RRPSGLLAAASPRRRCQGDRARPPPAAVKALVILSAGARPPITLPPMDIRSANADDHAAVRDLYLTAFGDHGRVVASLVDSLRAAHGERSVELVATGGADVVGHMLFTPSLLGAPRRLVEVAVLSPIAVRPGWQRHGIGGALIRRGLDALAERSSPLVFLE